MPATDEGVQDQELAPGLFLRKTEEEAKTIWLVKQGDSAISTSKIDLLSVILTHPTINLNTFHDDDPLVDGKVNVRYFKASHYDSNWKLPPDMAMFLARYMGEAASKHASLKEELEPKVAEARKEQAEREHKRNEYREKRAKVQSDIRELKETWQKEVQELLAWYEGSPGRLKRHHKRSWDIFHELGNITRGYINWHWSGNSYGANLTDVKSIEFKDEDLGKYEPYELPKYPEEKIKKLEEKLRDIPYVY